MQIFDLSELTPLIVNKLRKSPALKLKTLFRFFRKQQRFSAFGDYPLLAEICFSAQTAGAYYAARDIVRTCRSSDELKSNRSDSKLVTNLCVQVGLKRSRRRPKGA